MTRTDFQQALAGMELYNAMTMTPLQGLLGFNLYIKDENKEDEIKRCLLSMKKFCKVHKYYFENKDEAILIDIGLFEGIDKINDLKTEEWIKKIRLINVTTEEILNYYETKENKPSVEIILNTMSTLRELKSLIKKKLSKTSYESFICGSGSIYGN